jgi:hypothetical protein
LSDRLGEAYGPIVVSETHPNCHLKGHEMLRVGAHPAAIGDNGFIFKFPGPWATRHPILFVLIAI